MPEPVMTQNDERWMREALRQAEAESDSSQSR
jgi:hypothetical protein